MLNHIVIMGRLTRDPELRYTAQQTAVTSFSVAVDRDFGGRNGGEKQTDFISCTAWRSTAEFVNKYFHKGSMIVVSGRLQSRQWEDKNGQKRTDWEIVADNVYFGESSRRDNGGDGNYSQESSYSRDNSYSSRSSQSSAPAATFSDEPEDEGDLPF